MFKTEKWKESSYLALNFFRPLANPHMLPVMYLYIIFPMLPPWEMSQKILCATKVTENRNSSCSEFIVQSCCSVTKSCRTLWDPMDWSLPDSSVHGISRVRILEWVAITFSRGCSQPRDWPQVSWEFIAGGFYTIWVSREAPFLLLLSLK